MKKIKLNIQGLHCESCKTLIETRVDVLSGVKSVEIDYLKGTGVFEFEEKKISKDKIKKEIKKLGYSVTSEGSNPSKGRPYLLGFFIPLALFVIVLSYFLVSYFGGFEMLAQLNEGNVGYGVIFVIGLIAGFHCVGMCGCFVLAYSSNTSASSAQEKQGSKNKESKILPHFQYNFGRIISYSVIGGILGGVGSFFGINPVFSGMVLIMASIFMILIGLSFLFKLEILEKLKVRTPQSIAKILYKQKGKKSRGPLIIGLLNGFMPCGPLQAVQLYALTTGNVVEGALSLGIYAFGTAIIMFFFGLTVSTINAVNIKKMIKVSGVLIIFLGILMANRGLANFGYGFSGISKANDIVINTEQKFQEINMDLTYTGYSPNVLYIKPGIPVRWIINVKQMTGCTDAIMIESLGIEKDLTLGENIIEFTPPENVKEIKFSCWMKMVWGKFVVMDNVGTPTSNQLEQDIKSLPSGGGCSGNCGSETCGASTGGGCGCGR